MIPIKNLVLIDEIGRGISIYDGLSLVWLCAEYLANHIEAMTIFAAHYLELTSLPEKIESVFNIHMDTYG